MTDFETATIDLFYDDYFKGEKGHDDYTDDEITMSVNKDDIDDCLTSMRDILYKHFGIREAE